MPPMFHPTNKTSGFSVVELLIAVILVGVVVTVFVAAQLNMLSTATIQKAQLELMAENQTALSIIERDIRFAIRFETTLPNTFSDPYGPVNTNDGWTGSWTYKGNNPANPNSPLKVLLLRQNASAGHPLSTNRVPVYIKGFISNPYAEIEPFFNCTSGPTGALAYNYKLPYMEVLFVRDKMLYRRTLTDLSTGICNGPQYQKQSCPREDATPHASCRAKDEVLARNVTGFNITYYRQLDTPTPTFEDADAYNSSEADVLEDIDSIVVTLTTERTAQGQPRSVTESIRASRIN